MIICVSRLVKETPIPVLDGQSQLSPHSWNLQTHRLPERQVRYPSQRGANIRDIFHDPHSPHAPGPCKSHMLSPSVIKLMVPNPRIPGKFLKVLVCFNLKI